MTKLQNKTLSSYILIFLFGIVSCTYEFPKVPGPEGTGLKDADLSKTVFLGGTLFSGVANGVLVKQTSSESIPEIFLNSLDELKERKGFSPTTNNEIGFNIYENNDLLDETIGPYQLRFPEGADTTFFQEYIPGDIFSYEREKEVIQNFSFPKSQILDFTNVSSSPKNPYIAVYNRENNISLIDQISREQPSFFILNLGLEDLLGYAINGAEGNPDQNNIESHIYADILNSSIFESNLRSIVDELLSNPSSKGVLFNIPDFLLYPFFSNVEFELQPYLINTRSFVNEMAQRAEVYNEILRKYYEENPGIPFSDKRPFLRFPNDIQWGMIIEDKNLPDIIIDGKPLKKLRQAFRGEAIFYRNERFLAFQRGSFPENKQAKGIYPENPISEFEYLKRNEVDFIKFKISEFNQILNQVASQSNGRIIVFDLNAYFAKLFDGFNPFLNQPGKGDQVDGVSFLPTVDNFGIFSSDGLNLNPRGNALILNQLIDILNRNFDGNLNLVNPNDYAGNDFVIQNE